MGSLQGHFDFLADEGSPQMSARRTIKTVDLTLDDSDDDVKIISVKRGAQAVSAPAKRRQVSPPGAASTAPCSRRRPARDSAA